MLVLLYVIRSVLGSVIIRYFVERLISVNCLIYGSHLVRIIDPVGLNATWKVPLHGYLVNEIWPNTFTTYKLIWFQQLIMNMNTKGKSPFCYSVEVFVASYATGYFCCKVTHSIPSWHSPITSSVCNFTHHKLKLLVRKTPTAFNLLTISPTKYWRHIMKIFLSVPVSI